MFSYESFPPPKTVISTAVSITASVILFRTIATWLLPTGAMFSYESLPPPTTIMSTAASLAASVLLFRTMASDLIPTEFIRTLFKSLSAQLTVVIEESDGLTPNQIFEAANVFLGTKISPSTHRIKANKAEKDEELTVTVDRNQPIIDFFQSVKCTWVLQTEVIEVDRNSNTRSELKYFELNFHKKHKETVLKNYLPYVLKRATEIKDEKKAVKLHTMDYYNGTDNWSPVVLNHPATFESMAMDPEKKTELMEDLDMFVRRKEYYRRVGRAWKRGYLLYGPPGTGKSSLIAAMANYLKFDVFDLDLKEVRGNTELRKLLVATKNRSIIVIEDIDSCGVELQNREIENVSPNPDEEDDKISLSGLLNFVDGLWSSCGDERIIVFTTNHKERLDAALLRPGRMDVQVEMSYCTYGGFRVLASTYLQVKEEEMVELFGEIEGLLKKVEVTPAEIAGELMKKSDDVEIVLGNLIRWLQSKETEHVTKIQD